MELGFVARSYTGFAGSGEDYKGVSSLLSEFVINDSGKITENNKVQKSIELLREFEPMALELDPKGYYLTYSGGKDSDTNLEICLQAGVKFTANYNITTVDPPEVVKHIKETRERLRKLGIELYMHPPDYFTTGIFKGLRKNMWRLIIHKKMPPTRRFRYCCSDFKENGGQGKLCLTGVRWEESTQRKSRKPFEVVTSKNKDKKLFSDNDKDRRLFENCMQKGKRVINPIINYTISDVWEFLKSNHVNYCKKYDEGKKRLGCVGCPMAGTKQQEEDFLEYPHIKQLYINAFQLMLEHIWGDGRNTTWKTGEDVFEWWLYSTDKEQEQVLEGQIELEDLE